MSTLSPAVPTRHQPRRAAMLCNLYVPNLRQYRTHLFRTWSSRRREMRERAASSRILAATPRRFGSQPKISKTTPCKVAGGRGQGRSGPILDTSGKSAALLHYRTIDAGLTSAFRTMNEPALAGGRWPGGRAYCVYRSKHLIERG